MKEQKGLMSCYCMMIFKNNYSITELKKISFADISNPYGSDKTKYCYEWFKLYLSDEFLKILGPLLINGINLLVPIVIDALAKWRKFDTYNDQTEATFTKVVILSYFNIAVVTIVVNFKMNIPFLNNLKMFDGKYIDFTSDWYSLVGA